MKSLFLRIAIIFIVVVVATFYLLKFMSGNSGQTKAAGISVTGEFTPDTVTVAADGTQERTVTLKIKPSATSTMYIRGYRAIIDFDKTKITITGIDYKQGFVAGGLGQDNGNLTGINASGRIKIIGEIRTASGLAVTPSGRDFVTIKFKGKSTEGSNLFIAKSRLNLFKIINTSKIINRIYGSANTTLPINGGAPTPTVLVTEIPIISESPPVVSDTPPVTEVTDTPVPVDPNAPTETPTSTTDPSGPTPTLDPSKPIIKLLIKTKFQGISAKPPTDALSKLLVKIKLKGNESGQSSDDRVVEFVSDDHGIWSGEADFNVAFADRKFTVYIKGPYHIRKKICDTTPTEESGGTYRCSVGNIDIIPSATAVTTLDFSGILLLSGDLPVQDGSVTAYDTSLVRNNLGKTDDEAVAAADINRDGIVNTQDYSAIISSLSIKNDEE